ncbi:MAG TPA: hypothetical protein VGJ09_20845 [Bryobacteraceae bacterium]
MLDRMPTPDLSISKLGPESDALLRNLCEYYMHDMAEWFDIDTQADGSYSYDTSAVWKEGYDVYLARAGASIAGFAIVGSADAWLGDAGTHDVHEFFILRRFRRSGYGQAMALFLWKQRPGGWLVRVLEANAPALLFWRDAISAYAPDSFEEEARVIGGRPWRFFRFTSASESPAEKR